MDLELLTVTSLKQIAKEAGLSGYSRLNKEALIDKILEEAEDITIERIAGEKLKKQKNPGRKSPRRKTSGGKKSQRQKLLQANADRRKIKPKKIKVTKQGSGKQELIKPDIKKLLVSFDDYEEEDGLQSLDTVKQIGNLVRIGDYEVIRPLGSGAFGITYLAEKDGILYTVKEFKKKTSLQNLRSEMMALKEVQPCSGVPQYKSVFKSKGTNNIFLVTYYVEGMPLNKMIIEYKEGELPGLRSSDLNDIMISLTETLNCVHSRGRIHRDIKPPNIIVDLNTTPFTTTLINFGLSCLYSPDNIEVDVLKGIVPCRAQKGGNRGYYPKDAYLNNPFSDNQDYQTLDNFALGLLFYYLTTGNRARAMNLPPTLETGSELLNSVINNLVYDRTRSLTSTLSNLKRLSPNENYVIFNKQ
jgi:serine/threonine protein kinase